MSPIPLVLAQVASPAPVPRTDEVTVIGQRLKHWTGRVGTSFGMTSCRTVRSTGDQAIDAVGCAALRTCWAQYRPRYEAAQDRHVAAVDRERMTAAANADTGTCLKARRTVGIEQLVASRSGKPGS